MEAAHTHPVIIVFIRLLKSLSQQRKLKEASAEEKRHRIHISDAHNVDAERSNPVNLFSDIEGKEYYKSLPYIQYI